MTLKDKEKIIDNKEELGSKDIQLVSDLISDEPKNSSKSIALIPNTNPKNTGIKKSNNDDKAIQLVKENDKMEKYNNKPKNNQRKQNPTYAYALGGLGEVGKNMYILEEGNEI